MRKVFEIGGIVAAAVLIAFGIASIVMSTNGQSTVNSSLKQEQITGTPDMSPSGIAAEVKADKAAQTKLFAALHAAGVKNMTPSPIQTPSCTVAGQLIDTGTKARCFAKYMRIHTFAASSGLTYSQMGRYIAAPGTPLNLTDGLGATSDPAKAAIDPKTQQPVNNGRRDLWVTYTALTTALNSSYMASQLATFGLVVGIALLLSGIGFLILAIGGALEYPKTALSSLRKEKTLEPATPVNA
jgi:hypothetical protein